MTFIKNALDFHSFLPQSTYPLYASNGINLKSLLENDDFERYIRLLTKNLNFAEVFALKLNRKSFKFR